MNLFILNRNPIIAAQDQCDKHVVKMIVESAQMLSTVHRMLDGIETKRPSKSGKTLAKYFELSDIFSKAFDTFLVLMCPEISIKNRYSQFSSFVGIDSILVIDILCLARISNAFDRDPALLSSDITKDVLSLFDEST